MHNDKFIFTILIYLNKYSIQNSLKDEKFCNVFRLQLVPW